MESNLVCFYTSIFCVDAGKSIWMSISGGLGLNFLGRKMEKTRSMGEKMNDKVFFPRQKW